MKGKPKLFVDIFMADLFTKKILLSRILGPDVPLNLGFGHKTSLK